MNFNGFNPKNHLDKTHLVLDVLSQNQQVIGANIANVNTPGYKRQSISFEQYLGKVGSPLETELSKRLGPSPIMKNQGGEVSAAKEMIDMQQNMLFYQIATRRMTSVIQELKTVTQVGR